MPLTPYPAGQRPFVSYQMAIDSLGGQCTPSYEMRNGNDKELSAVDPLIRAGFAVVVPDFESQNMAYAAGLLAARTTLDGIRAAERFAPAGFPGTKTPVGLWGYSGGGQATGWAAEQQPGYAPELNVKGIAEGGVPPDLEQVARQIDGGPFFGVYFAASVGLSREFPEVHLDSVLNDKGKALKEKIGKECAETLVTGYPYQHMSDYTTVPDPLVLPSVSAVIEADRLGKATPTAPVYIYHSVADELIPIAGPDARARLHLWRDAHAAPTPAPRRAHPQHRRHGQRQARCQPPQPRPAHDPCRRAQPGPAHLPPADPRYSRYTDRDGSAHRALPLTSTVAAGAFSCLNATWLRWAIVRNAYVQDATSSTPPRTEMKMLTPTVHEITPDTYPPGERRPRLSGHYGFERFERMRADREQRELVTASLTAGVAATIRKNGMGAR